MIMGRLGGAGGGGRWGAGSPLGWPAWGEEEGGS